MPKQNSRFCPVLLAVEIRVIVCLIVCLNIASTTNFHPLEVVGGGSAIQVGEFFLLM